MIIFVNREQARERIRICASCEFLEKGILHRCKSCGCPISTKTKLKSSECPEGKWKAIKD